MKKVCLMILKEDCCGCHACEVACKQEHGLGVGPGFVRVIERSSSFLPVYCHHCAKAPCRDSCPVEAIHRDERGVVLVDEEKCMGCRECVEACPFGAMGFRDDREVAAKCDLCIQKLRRGEAPACALACPTGCIFWGDSNGVVQRVTDARPLGTSGTRW